jgi:hypothetical protein
MGKWRGKGRGKANPAAGRKGRSGDPRKKVAGRGRTDRAARGKAPSGVAGLRLRMRRRPPPPPSRMSRILNSLPGRRRAA